MKELASANQNLSPSVRFDQMVPLAQFSFAVTQMHQPGWLLLQHCVRKRGICSETCMRCYLGYFNAHAGSYAFL